jgi:hypothetical protein
VSMTTEAIEPRESVPEQDALSSRLRRIEEQPLDARAGDYAGIHDALRSTLEDGDSGHR